MALSEETYQPLPREVYQAFEDIVGPDNISQEPVILDSYAFQLDSTLAAHDRGHFMPRPVAAILPGSTEEVQAIVRTCNRYKIKYKAYSTGWSFAGIAAPFEEGMIQLDLKRMNRILEIDDRNMFAVIEPYVIGATLQAEVMKMGLNCHMIGGGAACSPLASACAMTGPGPDSIFMGFSGEALLALEWVMPTGDILKTGSLGSGCGWSCGEGPGPSTRGIIRGTSGSRGGLGVFTKCAIKLYPWPGPPVMPIGGTTPAYNTPLLDNIKAYTLAFPDWEAYFDTVYKIYDAEIGYIAHKQFNKFGGDLQAAMIKIISDPTKQLDDLEELLQTKEIQELTEEMRYSFQIVLAGMTPRDIEYQEKALNKILTETGGWKVAAMSEPAMERYTLLYLIKLCFKNLNYAYAGYIGTFTHGGTPDFVKSWYPLAIETKRKYTEEKGGIADTGGDAIMTAVSTIGGGGATAGELFIHYDPHDPESVKATLEFFEINRKLARERKLGVGILTQHLNSEPKDHIQRVLSASPRPAVFHWQRKIKQAFDPNDTGDMSYLYLEEPEKQE